MVEIKRISDELHEQLVGWTPEPIGRKVIEQQRAKLEPFGLHNSVDSSTVVNLPLPPVGGYKEVIKAAVEKYGRPVMDALTRLLRADLGHISPPKIPTNYSGWMVWEFGSSRWQPSDPPSHEVLVLDAENIMHGDEYKDLGKKEKAPVCLVALALSRLYVWVWDANYLVTTVPFGTNNVIVGHNVCYDRQFLDVEYLAEHSGNVFVDTMSMWVPVHGMGNQQRVPYLAMADDDYAPQWVHETGTNGLDAIYEYYFNEVLDKGVRDEIVNQGYRYCRSNLLTVVEYCLADVLATLRVFQALYPEYCTARPHGVTQTAAFFIGSYWIPLSADRYPTYFSEVEARSEELLTKIHGRIGEAVGAIVRDYLADYQDAVKDAKETPGKVKKQQITEWLYSNWVVLLSSQLQCLDWTPVTPKGRDQPIPTWYHKFLKEGFTMNTRETVFVLGVTYRGYPVLWEGDSKTGRFYTKELGDLPNPEERGKRVTQVFTKNSISLVEPDESGESVLRAEGDIQDVVIDLMSLVNWKGLRKRVYHLHTESPEGYPVFTPQITLGTITGRCADRFTQVLPNPKKTRLGTGVKSLIEVPKGYLVMGGDISSQELKVSAWLGDLEAPRDYRGLSRPFIGSCPLSVAVMTGTSATKTDVHSVMSVQLDVVRDKIKDKVYGALYGQGVSGCTARFQEDMPSWSEQKCFSVATQFTLNFVGKQVSYGVFKGGLASEAFNNIHRRVNNDPLMLTPVFRCAASTSLTANYKEYKTTKVNRIVQASGADWRDALLLFTVFFFDYYGIRGRVLLTIHDEIRTMVHEEDELQAAYALNLAHLYTTATFIDVLGLDLIPANSAWFEEIDVTRHLAKAWNKPGECPEYPEGLPTGRCYTAEKVLELIGNGQIKV